MSERRTRVEPFACAPGMRLEAHEKVSKLQFEALNQRFERMEKLLERLERRLWLTVYGVAGAILADVFQGLLSAAP